MVKFLLKEGINMSPHKVYISHTFTKESLKTYIKVKEKITSLGKTTIHVGEKSRSKIIDTKNWGLIYPAINSCNQAIFLLTNDLLESDELRNGMMKEEIKSVLRNNNDGFKTGAILVVEDGFFEKYFDIKNPDKNKFPIIENNIDNINTRKTSNNDYPGFLYVVKLKNFLKNTDLFLKRSELIRDRQWTSKIYELDTNI